MSKKNGRYNEDESKVGSDKRALGDLPNQGKPWTADDLCRAWTMWLDRAGKKTIALAVGRSLRSIQTFIPSKVCNPDKHVRGIVVRYLGESRTARKVYWTDHDDTVLKLCLASGMSLERIGLLLGREPRTITPHVQKRQRHADPTLF
jgi:hypothetical protein